MNQALPPGWTSTQFVELVALFQNGCGARRATQGRATVVLRLADVTVNGEVAADDLRELYLSESQIAQYSLQAGDLLVFRVNGSKHITGRVVAYPGPSGYVFCDHFIRCRVDRTLILPEFAVLGFQVPSVRHEVDRRIVSSAGQHTIAQGPLGEIELALPPLNEQRRIVDKIEALNAKSRRAKEALEAIPPLLERFRQSILAAAFRGDLTADWRAKNPDVEPASKLLERIRTERRRRWEEAELEKLRAKGTPPKDDRWKAKYQEPAPVDTEGLPELPEGWVWASVEELSALVTDGDHNPPKRMKAGIPHLTAKNIKQWQITFEGCSYLSLEGFEQTRRRYDPAVGDVLVTCVGTVGETAVVPSGLTFSADRNLAAIRPVPHGVSSEFMLLALNEPRVQAAMNSGSTAQPHLYLSDLRRITVPLPPVKEQRVLVERGLKVFRRCDALQGVHQSLGIKLSQLASSVLAKAFRGELVPQDPADEPASVLLERIRAEREGQVPASSQRNGRKRAPKRQAAE